MLGATTRFHLLPCSQDNILNQPWSDWDEDQFMGIANHEDVYVFVDNALLPALLQATHSRLHWGSGASLNQVPTHVCAPRAGGMAGGQPKEPS